MQFMSLTIGVEGDRSEGRKFKQGRQCRSVTDYVNQPWRFKRVLDGRRIQDAGREDSDTLDTFDATDLRNIDPEFWTGGRSCARLRGGTIPLAAASRAGAL